MADDCPCCNDKSYARYDEEYDAVHCVVCGKWLDSTCDDPDCEYCVGRPAIAPGTWDTEE